MYHSSRRRKKDTARILDATAGNRGIWKIKESEQVIWMDIEPTLERTPDVIIDCTNTDFPDEYFYTIFFDPPHWWGDKPASNIFTCRTRDEFKKLKEKYNLSRWGTHPNYYGTDKYKTKRDLLIFLHKAQQEFHRILEDGGMLWMKWNEFKLPLRKVLPFFKDWDEMLRFHVRSPLQRMGKTQTTWSMFLKKLAVVPKE